MEPAEPLGKPSGPTVAIAFGAGGARGFAHIPVIEALDEMGIRPVAIAGSSIGAIMGAGVAAGMSGAEIRDYSLTTVGQRGTVANRLWNLGPATMRDEVGGFRLGQFNLERILHAFLPPRLPRDFSGLATPFTAMATDYYGQCEVAIDEGPLMPALAASAAIPALFMPVHLGGRLMVDGGIFDPLPYERLTGHADIVIGVDVIGGPAGEPGEVPSRFDSLFGASQLLMLAAMRLKLRLARPDILLRPPVSGFRVLDFLKARHILAATESVKEELKFALDARMEALERRAP